MKKAAIFLALILFSFQNAQSQDITASWSVLKNGNVSISYKVYGQGKPILVANGGPGFSSKHMDGFARVLSKKGYAVILFDQRGTGNSYLNPGDSTVKDKVDSTNITLDLVLSDMKKLVEKEGKGKMIIMGHSFGGILAMSFAAKYPAMVEKLVLCSSAGINLDFLDYFGDNIFQRLQITGTDTSARPVTYDEREKAFYRMIRSNAPAYFYNKENVKQFSEMLTIPGSYSPDYNFLMWSDLFRINYNLTKKFKSFKKPTLVIQGRQDILGDETAIRISQSIPGSSLVFINRCGHVPWMDAPDEFFPELEKFLNQK